MSNIQKVVVTSVIVATLAITYYFAYFLPQQKLVQVEREQQEFLFEKQTECRNLCENLFEEDRQEISDIGAIILNPKYAYNEDQNVCLYSGGWLSPESGATTKSVTNCQTNEQVLTYTHIKNSYFASFCDVCDESAEEEYNSKVTELLGY